MAVTHSPDYVEAMQSPNQPRPKLSQNPQLAPAERDRLELIEEAERDLDMRGYQRASVIRFAPWTLSLDGAAHNSKRIEGVPVEPDTWRSHQPRLTLTNGLSVPYVYHLVAAPYITAGTRFRGKGESDSFAEQKAFIELPIGLARDMAHQQNQYMSQGGILVYEGDAPPQKKDGSWLDEGDKAKRQIWLTGTESSPNLQHAVHAAFDRMLTHMKAQMDKATAAHLSNSKEELREIRGNRFRQCVQYLMNVGVISAAPTWFQQRFDATSVNKKIDCFNCRRSVDPGTVTCQCGYVIDPFAGYGQTYTEETPGGLLTARRMTKQQLQQLGLYPRIKPLEEHVSDLNKAAKKKEANKEEKKEE